METLQKILVGVGYKYRTAERISRWPSISALKTIAVMALTLHWRVMNGVEGQTDAQLINDGSDEEFCIIALYGAGYRTEETKWINLHEDCLRVCQKLWGSYGRTSKARRYYWREVLVESSTRFERWAENHGIKFKPRLHYAKEYRDEYERIEGEVVEEIRAQHEVAPKYAYREKSQKEVLREGGVEIVALKARYAASPAKGKTIAVGSDVVAVEEFARRYFEGTGLTVLRAESVPFHVIFGTLMYPVVCDPYDERGRFASFGDRNAFDRKEKGATTTVWLPEDFGTPGYGRRRATEIAARLSEMPKYGTTIVEEFDWLGDMSEPLRQYLWAHRQKTCRERVRL